MGRAYDERTAWLARHRTPLIWLLQLEPLKILYVSKVYETIWERPLASLYADPHDWIEHVHAEDRPRVDHAYARLLGGDHFDEEYRILRPDGEVRWIRGLGSPIADAGGRINLAAGVVNDITEERAAESELHLMSAVFASAEDPIIIEDLEGRILDCNEETVRAYGFSREELIGQPARTVVHPDRHDRADELRRRCRAGEHVRNDENLRWTKEGEPIPVLLTLSPVRDETGEPVAIVNIAKDIRALKAEERERRAAVAAAERAEARERRALSRDLHDAVNQPLALARAKLAALREEMGGAEWACRVGEVESLIAEADDRTRSLSFQLSPPVLHDLGLGPAAEWLAEDLAQRFGLEVSVSDAGHAEPLSSDAREALFRSLRELLVNVARHGGTEKARVSLGRIEDALVIEVCDAGVGFDPRERDAGLGLVSVRERIEGLGGRFEIFSQPGRGTRARMLLPLPAPPA